MTFKIDDAELISMNKEQIKMFGEVDEEHDPLGYLEHSTVAQRYKLQSREEFKTVTISTYGCEKQKTRDNDFTVSRRHETLCRCTL